MVGVRELKTYFTLKGILGHMNYDAQIIFMMQNIMDFFIAIHFSFSENLLHSNQFNRLIGTMTSISPHTRHNNLFYKEFY